MQLTTVADVSHGGDLEMGQTWLSAIRRLKPKASYAVPL